MFDLVQPSIALNDEKLKASVEMWQSLCVRRTDTREYIINWTAGVARGAPGGKVKNIVINSHAFPAYLAFGQSFDLRHTYLFKNWKGLVENIWIPACFIALPVNGKTGNGHQFCSEIAVNANCNAIASTEEQWSAGKPLPFGKLDTMEGYVVCYGPNGKVISVFDLPSKYQGD